MGWRFEQGAGFLAGLSLAVGVGVARALEKEGFDGIDLKWPNDLVFRHHKLGGILIEVNGDALGPSTVVVGVGVNARMPREVRREIAQPVTDLQTVAGRGAKPRSSARRATSSATSRFISAATRAPSSLRALCSVSALVVVVSIGGLCHILTQFRARLCRSADAPNRRSGRVRLRARERVF